MASKKEKAKSSKTGRGGNAQGPESGGGPRNVSGPGLSSDESFRPDLGTRPDDLVGISDRQPDQRLEDIRGEDLRTPGRRNDDDQLSEDELAQAVLGVVSVVAPPVGAVMGAAQQAADLLGIDSLKPTREDIRRPGGSEDRSNRPRGLLAPNEEIVTPPIIPGNPTDLGARAKRRKGLLDDPLPVRRSGLVPAL